MDILEFYKDLEKHDWYFEFSDCQHTWNKGRVSLCALDAASRKNPVFRALFEAFNVHHFSGPRFGTEQKPLPMIVDIFHYTYSTNTFMAKSHDGGEMIIDPFVSNAIEMSDDEYMDACGNNYQGKKFLMTDYDLSGGVYMPVKGCFFEVEK